MNMTNNLQTPDTCKFITGLEKSDDLLNAYRAGYVDVQLKERRRIMMWYALPILGYIGLTFFVLFSVRECSKYCKNNVKG
jgi:hypothetical protein